MALRKELKERYSRMISLRDFGEDSLEKVMDTTVTVVGAGGLGSPALRLLSAIGFGRIRIIDHDIIELSNLQRQTIYNTEDLGKPKAEVAAENLSRANPNVAFEPICSSISQDNTLELLAGSDIILDGLDSIHSRRAVNLGSQILKIPYIYAGAVEYYANVSTFVPQETGCFHCLVGDLEDDPNRVCSVVGVSPTLLSVVAAIEVQEALMIATKQRPNLFGRLMHIDMKSLSFDSFEINPVDNCLICSDISTQTHMQSSPATVSQLCSGNFRISSSRKSKLDLTKITEALQKEYNVEQKTTFLVVTNEQGLKATIMSKGSAIIKGMDTPEEALSVYHELVSDN
ncbi:MAG: HesA/MoeB/ThiF family protein [Candidatus Thorarchaeota archaeon]